MEISFDVETTGLNIYRGDKIFAYAAHNGRRAQVVRFDKGERREGRKRLARLLRSKDTLIGHNLLFDFGACRQSGFRIKDGRAFEDTFLLANIIDNDRQSYALDQICWELGEYSRDIDERVKKLGRDLGTYQAIPVKLFNKYQELDVERALVLWEIYKDELSDPAVRDNYDVEKRLIWVALRMMENGVRIFPERTQALIDDLSKKIERSRKRLNKLAGREVNPRSPKQLIKLLYEDLSLPIVKRKKKTGNPSTEKEVLFELFELTRNPILRELGRLRSFGAGVKQLQSYLDARDVDDIIHPSIRPSGSNEDGTRTGRQSISDPNLMGVQKDTSRLNPFPIPSRACFGPKEGTVWFCVDYAGIQAILLVGRSGDTRAMEIFRQGGSMHDAAAKIFYGKRYKGKSKSKALYGAAKNANFAKPFGASREKMMRTLGLASDRTIIEYEKTFPQYCGVNAALREEVQENGYITTTHGRKLKMLKRKSYMGANYFAQGEEACIMKRAEIRVDDYLQEATGGEARLLMPIHDEIIIEYPEDRLSDAPEILREISERMTNFPEIPVPLSVDVKLVRENWGGGEEYNDHVKT